jgi:DNA-binding Xre family transcriptional regulator
MSQNNIDTSSLEATENVDHLKPIDRAAANRAYQIYSDMHKESVKTLKAFQKANPNANVPDELRVTQTSVAESVGWTQGNLSQYLTGAVPIREKALQKLCTALNCNPWDIRPEMLSDTDLLDKNRELAGRVNEAEDFSTALTNQLNGILSELKMIEGTHEVVDKILKENNEKKVAA